MLDPQLKVRVDEFAARCQLNADLRAQLDSLLSGVASLMSSPSPDHSDCWGSPFAGEKAGPLAGHPFSPSDGLPSLPPVARYEDLGLIGEGGMGEVRRVRDRTLNRIMAMKIIRRELMDRSEPAARFVEEAQTTAQLQHPGVVPVHEIGRLDDGRYYFTMKEVEGRTLKEVLYEVHQGRSDSPIEATRPNEANPTWTFRRLVDAFHKVCEAVAYAHARGVVHRDLKPSNVMVGPFGEVLVLDWGLAKVQGQPDRAAAAGDLDPVVTLRSSAGAHTTAVGTVAGTPAYMPPEQARGEVDRLGPASDVYALGAILYEILSGRPPYEGFDGLAVLHQVLADSPVLPGPLPGHNSDLPTLSVASADHLSIGQPGPQPSPRLDIPEELKALCVRAMARDMEDRFPNAGALARAVGSWLEDEQRRDRALSVVARADAFPSVIAALRSEAAGLKDRARSFLSRLQPDAPVKEKLPGWTIEDQASQLTREADLKELEYLQLLRGSLTHEPGLPETHARLAAYYHVQHMKAESLRNTREAEGLELMLRAHQRGEYAAYLTGDGALTVLTDPAGASVDLYRYEVFERRLVPRFVRSLGYTPLHQVSLSMGSYLLKIYRKGHVTVRYPVQIGRQEHWDGVPPGETVPLPIYLPRTSELEIQDLYVPAGPFRCGGDVEAVNSLPGCRPWVDAFIIRRFAVTNHEYLTFLDDLVARGLEAEALKWVPRARGGTQGMLGPAIYGRDADGSFVLRADADGDQWQPDWPVAMTTWFCAEAYSKWEAARTGRPWRLASEIEWEKAAKGVDGRRFPWGDFADPTWARMFDSATPPMPTVVGSYPVDGSPYGVRGMGGNVRDWCLDRYQNREHPVSNGRFQVVLPREVDAGVFRTHRGGYWCGPSRHVRSSSRAGDLPASRHYDLGFRLVRALDSQP